jgi:hypothetical protein
MFSSILVAQRAEHRPTVSFRVSAPRELSAWKAGGGRAFTGRSKGAGGGDAKVPHKDESGYEAGPKTSEFLIKAARLRMLGGRSPGGAGLVRQAVPFWDPFAMVSDRESI